MYNRVRYFYEFGPFRLDPEKHRLLHRGEPVPLSPKAIDALLVLVQNAGKPLERETIIQAVWGDALVEDANLTVAISNLRKALAQNDEAAEYIETIPRIGYRFLADVRKVQEDRPPIIIEKHTVSRTVIEEEDLVPTVATDIAVSEPRRPVPFSVRSRMSLGAAVLVLVLSSVVFIGYSARSPKTAEPGAGNSIKSLAVLPFKPLNPEASDEYLGLGLSDSLITRLSNVKQFVVRPTGAVVQLNHANQDLRAVGRELGVDGVLDGRIRRDGDRIRVTVQLVRVSDGTSLWAETFDEQFTDIFSVQDRISRNVADALALQMSSEEKRLLAKRGTDNTEAFRAYLKGRYAWNKRATSELDKAIKFFQQAIDLDPTYASAYAGMADCYISLGDYGSAPPKEMFPLAKASAMKALEIDDTLAEAHSTLAHVKFLYDWDWAGAEREYRRAIELKPNYATAHHWYGWFLIAMGRSEDAMREITRAEELDPLSLIIKANVGTFLYFTHRYDEAIEIQRKVVEADPDFLQGRRKLAFSLEAKGLEQEAIDQWLKVEEQYGTSAEALNAYRKAYRTSGLRGYWMQAVEVEREDAKANVGRAGAIAAYYARLGDRDQAFAWLEKAYKDHEPWLVYMNVSPIYDNLRSDPRFKTFLNQIGL